MPRTGRLLLPHFPHHIVQRGHNRQNVFSAPADYRYYLESLRTWKRTYRVKVHAYCLMTNHVHLVLEPSEDVSGLSALMKRIAGRQTRYFNRNSRRTGTLWGGRFKSSPIQTDRYFLTCCRYVELNPTRAGLADAPADYPWSSFGLRSQESGNWLDEHACYLALGSSAAERRARYAAMVLEGLTPQETLLFRTSVQRGQLTGDSDFVDAVETLTGRRIEHRAPGAQPRKGMK